MWPIPDSTSTVCRSLWPPTGSLGRNCALKLTRFAGKAGTSFPAERQPHTRAASGPARQATIDADSRVMNAAGKRIW